MAVRLNPYISFLDNAREAMDFYQSVFGGEVSRMTFGDLPMGTDPAEADKVMHSMLETDDGLTLMAADTPNHLEYKPGTNHSVSLSGDDDARLRGYWDQLSDGGTVVAPLMQAPWGDTFGMCIDRFGVNWMVNIAGTPRG